MLSERQRIEASPSPSINNMPPPPPYEEVNGLFASQTYDGSTDGMGYFLGEVTFILTTIFLIGKIKNGLKHFPLVLASILHL